MTPTETAPVDKTGAASQPKGRTVMFLDLTSRGLAPTSYDDWKGTPPDARDYGGEDALTRSRERCACGRLANVFPTRDTALCRYPCPDSPEGIAAIAARKAARR